MSDVPKIIIWVTYALLPLIVATFLAYYRLWSKNDYSLYESDGELKKTLVSYKLNQL